jgi:hypothetical protein
MPRLAGNRISAIGESAIPVAIRLQSSSACWS